MFESRLQYAQLCLVASAALVLLGAVALLFEIIVVGVFCLVVQAVFAAIGCYLYADTKAYPPVLGVAVGVAFGAMGALLILILPDQTEESHLQEQRRLAKEGMKPSRRRRKDPGYEVLDEDPSPYD